MIVWFIHLTPIEFLDSLEGQHSLGRIHFWVKIFRFISKMHYQMIIIYFHSQISLISQLENLHVFLPSVVERNWYKNSKRIFYDYQQIIYCVIDDNEVYNNDYAVLSIYMDRAKNITTNKLFWNNWRFYKSKHATTLLVIWH